jgi:hypothetical protein
VEIVAIVATASGRILRGTVVVDEFERIRCAGVSP